MDSLQLLRRKIFFGPMPINKEMRGIEIGPFIRPTVFPSECRVDFADYYTTEELREQAQSLNIPVELVDEVKYVLRSAELHELAEKDAYDFIIANHVLEHVVDPFRWMKNLEPVLKVGGRFLITLPDKRFSFDKFRPDTSLAHFIEDFTQGGERSIPEHATEAALYYDRTYVNEQNDAMSRLKSDFLEKARNEYHPGMHVHVFQAENFLNTVLRPFLNIGWLNLKLEAFTLNYTHGEFSFSLIKTEAPVADTTVDIFNRANDTLPYEQKPALPIQQIFMNI